MLAVVYPFLNGRPGPTGDFSLVALGATIVVLGAVVASAWVSLRRLRTGAPVAPEVELPKAA